MKRKGAIIGAVVVVVVLCIPMTAWFLRGVIATSIARDELAGRGLSCDDRFSVSLSATFDEATIGPTRCTHEGGVVEAIELLGDVTVQLEGTEPTAVRAESLRLALRASNVRGGSSWASALRRVNLEQQAAGLIKGLSELSTMDLPATTVARVEIVRGGAALATATAVTITPGWELGLAVDRVRFSAGPMGVGQLVLSNVTGTATPPEVTLRGRATARAGVSILSFERGGPFSVDATALDTDSPRFRFTGNF